RGGSETEAEVSKSVGDDDDDDDGFIDPAIDPPVFGGTSSQQEDDVGVLLAKEMTNMSLNEREQVYQDIHGVRDYPEETPQYLQEKQEAMQQALDSIPAFRRTAYNVALRMDASHVKDEKLRIRFLRCEIFDAKKAALRFTKHFEQKLELFGKELLCTTIRQRHLSPDGLQAVMEGTSQNSERDSRGRLVTIQFSNLNSNLSRPTKANLERVYYMCMVNAENEENQRKGSVIIVGEIPKTRLKAASWKIPRLLETLPFRREAIHVCFDPSRKLFARLFKNACESFTKRRLKLHTGGWMHTKTMLTTYGIPVEQLPIHDDGTAYLSPAHTLRWETRRQWEEQQDGVGPAILPPSLLEPLCFSDEEDAGFDDLSSLDIFPDNINPLSAEDTSVATKESVTQNSNNTKTPIPESPPPLIPFSDVTEHDVLMGRGKRLDKHAGNIKFRNYVSERRAQYDECSQYIKTTICKEIISVIHDQNGRFLQLKNGKYGADSEWAEVENSTARTKVSNCFRSFRRSEKASVS
ncbi:MAG: hypothetical protein SGILL_010539, partial [Bacillariaceae sp.]